MIILKKRRYLVLLGLSALVLYLMILSSCGDESDSASIDNADGEWADGEVADGETTTIDGDTVADGDVIVADGDDNPPENEIELRMSLPKTGKDFVFIMNNESKTLVMIDAANLAIRTMQIGNDPISMETVKGNDIALVIDAGTDKLIAVFADEKRLVSWPMGEDKLTRYNSIKISPSGEFAVIYFNFEKSDGTLGSLQEIGIVDLRNISELDELDQPISHYTVGLNPSEVVWSDSGDQAFVITDMGITAFDFTNPDKLAIKPNIQLEEIWTSPVDREIKITNDGRFCMVRRYNTNKIIMVDLESHDRYELEFEVSPTDLDLTSDSKYAIAVLRENNELAYIPLPEGMQDNSKIKYISTPEGAGVVEIAPDNDTLLLYSTLLEQEGIWIYSLSDAELNYFPLQKGVESVTFSRTGLESGLTAIIFHQKTPGRVSAGDDLYEIIDKSEGYSVLMLDSEVQVLQLTDAKHGDFTFSEDGQKGYVIVTDKSSVRQIHIIDITATSGATIKQMDLSSVPTGVGIIPQNELIYISQDHPDGRITFLDTNSDKPITVTGFELNGEIE